MWVLKKAKNIKGINFLRIKTLKEIVSQQNKQTKKESPGRRKYWKTDIDLIFCSSDFAFFHINSLDFKQIKSTQRVEKYSII